MNNNNGLFRGVIGSKFIWLDEVDSTNDYLKANIEALPHGTLLAAGHQTGGKGTRGRGWSDKPNTSLMFSVLLKDLSFPQLSCLSLVTGLSVCEALAGTVSADFYVKWPNDIVTSGRKLCGILCESRLSGENVNAIIGIGVNLLQTAEEFAAHGLVYATSLRLATEKTFEPLPLAAKIAERLDINLAEYKENGFSGDLRTRYKTHCITLGHECLIIRGESEVTAFVHDVKEDGSLLCEINGSLEQLYSGDVSVRGLYGYV